MRQWPGHLLQKCNGKGCQCMQYFCNEETSVTTRAHAWIEWDAYLRLPRTTVKITLSHVSCSINLSVELKQAMYNEQRFEDTELSAEAAQYLHDGLGGIDGHEEYSERCCGC